MPHNVLVSKIRCHNPNKQNAAIHNRNHFIYIGTREGTDLTPLSYENTVKFEKEMASSEDYVRYIAKRPHSHGLFGNVPLEDINEFSKKIYSISKEKRNIYRGIVSLDFRDAEELGYYDKSKWETYIRSVIPDVAKEFGINIDKLQWAAAYHAEAGHPHVHYMFWSSERKVNSSFIHPSKQATCREILSGKMFEEERSNEVINKTISQDYILEFGKELMSNEISKISAMTSGLIHKTTIPQKITVPQLDKTTEELMNLIPLIPQKGRLNYKFMPPEVKDQINKIVDSILENKSVNEEYEKFLNSVDKISLTYSPSEIKQKHAVWRDNAITDIRKDLSNIILTHAKKELKNHSDYSSYVTILLEQYEKQHDYQLDQFDENLMNDNILPDDSNISFNQTQLHEEAIQILNDLYKERPDDDMISYSLGKVHLDKNTDYYDINKAKDFLEKSSKVGNPFAQYKLGKVYSSPDFGEPDYPLAISYLEASAAQGNDFAMYQLAVLYKNSDLEFYDIGKAIDYFKDSAKSGNQFAQYQLGKVYSKSEFERLDYSLSISYLKASAAQGNDSALYQLGRIYSNEDLPTYNMDLAISYLMKSSNKNNSFAQLQLGIIYLWGKGVKRDTDLGKHYLLQSINNGNEFAQKALDSYETYRLQYVMNVSYKLFNSIFDAISNENDRASTLMADRYFRNLSKKAMIEEQLRNPHKHSQSHEN